jgi:hypothetical protein
MRFSVPAAAVHKQFNTTGFPQTFVFDRGGKPEGIFIDQSTQRHLFTSFAKPGLQLD